MTSALALVAATVFGTGGAAACPAEAVPPRDGDLRALYESGVGFEAFLGGTRRRRGEWHRRYEAGAVAPDLLARAQAVGGPWYLLVVAEDWCGDSANTVPFLARLVEQVDALDMRIVDSSAGRAIMHEHPTPDGRPATPTILLLDAEWQDAGCFVERPPFLQAWFLENPDGLGWEALHEQKYAWYEDDAGASTLDEVVRMLEGAAAGVPVCR